MLKHELIVLVITSAWIYLVKADNKDGVHLLLKNVNYNPYRKHVDKKYDVLDFSIYLPKTTKPPKSSIRNSRLTYSGHITNTGTVEEPPVRKLKSSHQKNFGDVLPSNTAPYFESLSGIVPQRLKAPYNPPFYGPATVAPPSALQRHNSQFTIKLPNHGATIQRPSPVTPQGPGHFLPTAPPPLTIPNRGAKTEIFYGGSGKSQYSPNFEAYTVPKPFVQSELHSSVIRNQNAPYYEAYTAPKADPITTVLRNPKTPYYEAHTRHTGTGFQNSQGFNPHAQVQNTEELIHQSPIKGLLLNSVVYHDDSYRDSVNPDKYENSEETDDSDESYQVSEHPQESKKNYQKRHPMQTVLPFVISVRDPAKTPVSNQQRQVEYITPQPLVAELSLASPISSNTSRENLKDAKKRSKTHAKNATAKAVTDEIKYFQYANVHGPGSYNAGVRKGNQIHGIETHERALKDMGLFQKRVRWTDKHGGYGEHYWDLGHSKKTS